MYYILNAANQPEGPYPADWIRSNARPGTLVSNGQTWLKYSAHPDFKPLPLLAPAVGGAIGPSFCSNCGGPLRQVMRFCTKCGSPIAGMPAVETPQAAFQHPYDVAATRVLAKTPGLDVLIKLVSGTIHEKLMNINFVGSAVRVDESQYSQIYRLYLTAAQRLDIQRLPDLYVKRGVDSAFTNGIEKRYVVLGTELLDLLEEDEVMVVLAHELGHVKCEHVKYNTMVNMLREYGQTLIQASGIPLAPALFLGVEVALVQWYQKAELSGDRASLLATRDVTVVQRTLSKLAGYSPAHCERLDLDRLKQQAVDLDEIGSGSLIEKALKVWTLLQSTHPVPILRIREIDNWARSADYERIVEAERRRAEQQGVAGPTGVCPRCGNRELEELASFCGLCGGDVRAPTPTSVPAAPA